MLYQNYFQNSILICFIMSGYFTDAGLISSIVGIVVGDVQMLLSTGSAILSGPPISAVATNTPAGLTTNTTPLPPAGINTNTAPQPPAGLTTNTTPPPPAGFTTNTTPPPPAGFTTNTTPPPQTRKCLYDEYEFERQRFINVDHCIRIHYETSPDYCYFLFNGTTVCQVAYDEFLYGITAETISTAYMVYVVRAISAVIHLAERNYFDKTQATALLIPLAKRYNLLVRYWNDCKQNLITQCGVATDKNYDEPKIPASCLPASYPIYNSEPFAYGTVLQKFCAANNLIPIQKDPNVSFLLECIDCDSDLCAAVLCSAMPDTALIAN